VAWLECANVARVVEGAANCPVLSYGFMPGLDYRALRWQPTPTGAWFQMVKQTGEQHEVCLSVPGRHNVLNALAAIAMCESVGLETRFITSTLTDFRGISRRWQTILKEKGIWIVDDYAHHPSEVAATLAAARSFSPRRIIAVFQPHRFTRTQALCEEFGQAFGEADYVIINEIYSAFEHPIPGVTGENIARAIRRNANGKPVEFIADMQAICDRLMELATPGDLILTMGAGDINTVAQSLAERLMDTDT